MNPRRHLQCRVLLLLLMAMALVPSALSAAAGPRVGEQVQDFEFTDFGGNRHQLSDFAGRYVLLDFWATWCGPCVKEVPTLKRARALYGKRGLEILGMDSDTKFEKARKFVEKNQIEWPQAAPSSTKQVIDQALNVKWYPAMILLDPQHKILLVSGDGKAFLNGDELLKALDRLLPVAAGLHP